MAQEHDAPPDLALPPLNAAHTDADVDADVDAHHLHKPMLAPSAAHPQRSHRNNKKNPSRAPPVRGHPKARAGDRSQEGAPHPNHLAAFIPVDPSSRGAGVAIQDAVNPQVRIGGPIPGDALLEGDRPAAFVPPRTSSAPPTEHAQTSHRHFHPTKTSNSTVPADHVHPTARNFIPVKPPKEPVPSESTVPPASGIRFEPETTTEIPSSLGQRVPEHVQHIMSQAAHTSAQLPVHMMPQHLINGASYSSPKMGPHIGPPMGPPQMISSQMGPLQMGPAQMSYMGQHHMNPQMAHYYQSQYYYNMPPVRSQPLPPRGYPTEQAPRKKVSITSKDGEPVDLVKLAASPSPAKVSIETKDAHVPQHLQPSGPTAKYQSNQSVLNVQVAESIKIDQAVERPAPSATLVTAIPDPPTNLITCKVVALEPASALSEAQKEVEEISSSGAVFTSAANVDAEAGSASHPPNCEIVSPEPALPEARKEVAEYVPSDAVFTNTANSDAEASVFSSGVDAGNDLAEVAQTASVLADGADRKDDAAEASPSAPVSESELAPSVPESAAVAVNEMALLPGGSVLESEINELNVVEVAPSGSLLEIEVDPLNVAELAPSGSALESEVDESNVVEVAPSGSLLEIDVDQLNVGKLPPSGSVLESDVDQLKVPQASPSVSHLQVDSGSVDVAEIVPSDYSASQSTADAVNVMAEVAPRGSELESEVAKLIVAEVAPSDSALESEVNPSDEADVASSGSVLESEANPANVIVEVTPPRPKSESGQVDKGPEMCEVSFNHVEMHKPNIATDWNGLLGEPVTRMTDGGKGGDNRQALMPGVPPAKDALEHPIAMKDSSIATSLTDDRKFQSVKLNRENDENNLLDANTSAAQCVESADAQLEEKCVNANTLISDPQAEHESVIYQNEQNVSQNEACDKCADQDEKTGLQTDNDAEPVVDPSSDAKPVKQRRERSLKPGGGKRALPANASSGFVSSSNESAKTLTYTSEELRRILSDIKKAAPIERPSDLKEFRILVEGPGGIMTPMPHVPRDSGGSYSRQPRSRPPIDPVPFAAPPVSAAASGPWARQAVPPPPPPQQTTQSNIPIKRGRGSAKPPVRPGRTNRQDALDCLSRDVHSILNKITPQTFEKLSDRLLRLPIENDALLEKFVEIVFEKAVMEPNFANLYAELCIKMKEHSVRWSFVHLLFDQDSNQYRWIRELGQDMKLAGPYVSVRDCEEAALSDTALPVRNLTDKLIPEKLLVIQGTFVKILKSAEHNDQLFVSTQRFDSVPQSWYSDNGFTTEQEALSSALKKNTFHYRLLDKCQNEFFKTNPYEEADQAQAEMEKRTGMSSNERLLEQARIQDLRGLLKFKMLGNIRFIGELYKVGLLKMQIIETCLQRLLGWLSTENRWSEEVLDEHYLESMCKLYTTVGAKFESDADKKKKNFAHQDHFFQRLQTLAQDRRLNARIRFGIQDLIDLQKNRWTPRREEAKPQTLEEIHRQVALQTAQPTIPHPVQHHQIQNPYTAQPSFMPSPHGGHMHTAAVPKRRPSDPQIGRTAPSERARDVAPSRGYHHTQALPQHPQHSISPSVRADERRRDTRAQPAAAAVPIPRREQQEPPAPRHASQNISAQTHHPVTVASAQNSTRKVLSPEVVKRRVDTLISEYLSNLDATEAVECMDELPPQASSVFVQEIIQKLLECGAADKQRRMYDLVDVLLRQNRLDAAETQAGLQACEQVYLLLDSVLDNKSAPEVLGTLLGMLLGSSTGVCSLGFLKDLVRIIMDRSADDGVEGEVVVLVGRLIFSAIRTWVDIPGTTIHDLRRNPVSLSDLSLTEADSIVIVTELALYTVFQDVGRVIISTAAEASSAVSKVVSRWGPEEGNELSRLCNSWGHLNL